MEPGLHLLQKTGDWRGNKSYYRSGFTRDTSTANFNSSATAGALLCGQIIGSERAMADGRAGLMQFPFWMWTHSAGVGQEYIDHYYWAIATAGNKVFPDFCAQPEDRMAGWSIIEKTVNDLAGAYHPNLKKLLGPASRTYYEHVLGQQDGLYHILHVISPRGALSDLDTGTLPALTAAGDATGRPARAISAWGHDYPAATVALQSMSGPWAAPWIMELVDEKPLPWSLVVEKEGDPVVTYFGEHYGTFEFLDRLADLVPPPRKHRHRYHGVFAPNHKLRSAVTALAIGNVGKQREATTGGDGNDGRATGGCCDTKPDQKPRSHDTSRIAWAKLMARVGEEFPLQCPGCGGDIRLIAFIIEPGPIRKILTHLGEPLEPPPVSPARGPPADWGELVQVHDDRAIFQGRIDELPVIDIRSL